MFFRICFHKQQRRNMFFIDSHHFDTSPVLFLQTHFIIIPSTIPFGNLNNTHKIPPQ
jgi:hypothetical protein